MLVSLPKTVQNNMEKPVLSSKFTKVFFFFSFYILNVGWIPGTENSWLPTYQLCLARWSSAFLRAQVERYQEWAYTFDLNWFSMLFCIFFSSETRVDLQLYPWLNGFPPLQCSKYLLLGQQTHGRGWNNRG